MKPFGVLLALLCLHQVSAINNAREKGLQKIEANVTNILKLGNETNGNLKWKPQRIHNIYSVILGQTNNIKKNNILELEDEVKVCYLKAEILGSSNKIYTCIANTANYGEADIKKEHENFEVAAYRILKYTEENQKNAISSWTKNINVKEAAYRNEYNAATFKIINAKEIKEVDAVVQKFIALTQKFEKDISNIETTITIVQSQYMNTMHNNTEALANKLQTTKNQIFSNIKKCFTLKFYN